jgi:glycerol-1-phosphate dehydrogenase [NAD(P)+]
MDFSAQTPETLISAPHSCACGRTHATTLRYLNIGPGAVKYLPQAMAASGVSRPFIVCDRNTHAAAWRYVEPVLHQMDVHYTLHMLSNPRPEPDEHTMGELVMGFDPNCDVVIALGSGVINDCSKVLAHAVGKPSMVICTAPSMDGFASNSSSMIRDRVKVSLYNACPDAILADTRILVDAPKRMLQAGFGDMIAKYVSVCEWRFSHLITGEYYCENIAGLVRASLKKVVDAAPGLKARDPKAVEATVEGLILSGIAMSFAQISRPASGLEHYFSHMWEMMALDRGEPSELHGIQVGVGTLLTLNVLRYLAQVQPDRARALAFVESFSNAEWEAQTRAIFGKAAQTIITQEHTKYHKNDAAQHAIRLERIVDNWPQLLTIMQEELPDADKLLALSKAVGMPTTPQQLGISLEDTHNAFLASRDIRDKYLTSSLLWDLGLLYETPLVIPE